MDSISNVYMPRAIFYGMKALKKVGEEAKSRGTNALVISDRIMESLNYVTQCTKCLKESDVLYTTYLSVDSEPTDTFVDEATELLRKNNCDIVIALGGGSCIDTAKAVAVLATNGGDISEYMANKKIASKNALPLIAIPTTAGTGSEATDVTVITNTTNDVKMMIKQPAFLPEVAIIDPLLTISSPQKVTAATGIDALTHGIEAFISRRSHPYTDTFALSAIKLIYENIYRAYEDGEDMEARENMSMGALMAGVAFSNSSVCLVHGMSRPIGALFHVPHGVSNAMLLPAVLEFSKEDCIDQLAEIGIFIDQDLRGNSKEFIADSLVKNIKKLCVDLNIPNIKDWGIEKSKFKKVVQKMAKDALASGSPANNPRIPTEQEIIDLYDTCYDYNM